MTQTLGGHYQIEKQLAIGGFGKTFIARDLHLPGNPLCVIKQLNTTFNNPKDLETAKRLFNQEAEVLYTLGEHDQIPKLLAHFEENQAFYLAQEFVEGNPLSELIIPGQPWSETQVMSLVQDILQILTFVHYKQVIHRDIKPSNLLWRDADQRIVLIDFGAVKATQPPDSTTAPNGGASASQGPLTVAIGTSGYMPVEQCSGKPRLNSDLYAVGMTALEALTGLPAHQLTTDVDTGEIDWRSHAPTVSQPFADFLDILVRYDCRDRFKNASEAVTALRKLPTQSLSSISTTGYLPATIVSRPPSTTHSATAGAPVTQPPASPSAPKSARNVNPAGSGNQTHPVSSPDFGNPALRYQAPNQPPNPASIQTPPPTNHQQLANAINSPAASNSTQQTYSSQNQKSSLPKFLTQPVTAIALTVAAALGLLALGSSFSDQLFSTRSSEEPAQTNSQNSNSTSQEPSTTSSSNEPNNRSDSPENTTANPDNETDLERAERLAQQAQDSYDEGEYEFALALFNEADHLGLDTAEVAWGRCLSLDQLNREKGAREICAEAANIPSGQLNVISFLTAGMTEMNQSRYSEALALFNQAERIDPDNEVVWVGQGIAHTGLEDFEQAIEVADKGLEKKPNVPELWVIRGNAQLLENEPEDAIESADSALGIRPNMAEAEDLKRRAEEAL